MGVALGAVVALAAPFLAGLVGVPGAASYLMVLGLSCIPGAALVVPQSILQRRLQLQATHLATAVASSSTSSSRWPWPWPGPAPGRS